MDPSLGLGPVFTINPLKSGTSNSDVAYRLYYAGEACKYSATHRNAVIKAEARKQCDALASARAGSVAVGKGIKLQVVDEKRFGDAGSEAGSDMTIESSTTSASE